MPAAMTDDARRQLDTLFRVGTLAHDSDGQLLGRVAAGVEPAASAAFAALVERHGPMVLRTCRRILGDAHDAEDAAQAAFLVLARRAGAVRRRESAASWLFGVALRIARRARRDAARRRRHERHAARPIADTPEPADGWPELYEELDRLPSEERSALVLCYLEGLTHEQAAARLSTSLRTFRRRLAGGRERLGRRLLRRGVGPALALLAAESARAGELPAGWAAAMARSALAWATGLGAGELATAARWAELWLRRMTMNRLGLTTAAAFLIGSASYLAASAFGGPPPPPVAIADEPAPKPRAAAPADKPAAAAPASARAVVVRVIDAETGEPIAGAPVEARVYRGGYENAELTTAADGRCRVPLPEQAPEWVLVNAYPPGHVPMSISLRGPELLAGGEPERTVKLPRGTPIGGVVHDAQGRPIAGARVIAWYTGKAGTSGEARFSMPEPAAVTTDADGRWRADVLPADAQDDEQVMVRLKHPGHVSERWGFSRKIAVDKARAGDDVQVMRPGFAIGGRVVGPAGEPVADAAVRLAFSRSSDDFETTRTDARGRFRFAHVDDEYEGRRNLSVAVEAPGFAPAAVDHPLRRDRTEVEIRLDAGAPLGGRVVDADGRPQAGAVVALDSFSNARAWTWKTTTDADGRFLWPHGPSAGEVVLNAYKAPFTRTMDHKVVAGTTDTLITLHRPQRLTGTVVDADTGAPIDQFRLIPGWGPFRPGAGVAWRRDSAKAIRGGAFDETGLFPNQGLNRSLRIEAEGYLPAESKPFLDSQEEVEFAFELRKGADLNGVIHGPDGRPARGAEVFLLAPGAGGPPIKNGRVDPFFHVNSTHVTTADDGRFAFPPQARPPGLLVLHDRGYIRISPGELPPVAELTLTPWGRIEGTLTVGGKPGAGLSVGAYVPGAMDPRGFEQTADYKGQTDADGHFAFDRVFAGHATVYRDIPLGPGGGTLFSHLRTADVAPGETARVALGGGGRPVVVRYSLPGGTVSVVPLDVQMAMLNVKLPPPPTPEDFDSFPVERKRAWHAQFRQTPAGRAYYDRVNRFALVIGPDGALRGEDVPPGDYELALSLRGGDDRTGITTANLKKDVTVPAGDGPFDLGTVELDVTRFKTLNVGEPAPALVAKTLDGRPFTLADHRGRFVLLDFWATWCGPCLEETPSLKAAHDAFGQDDRLVMVGLSLDEAADAPRKYADEHGLKWTQVLLGHDNRNPATTDFGIQSIPQILLIDPDGKVIARDLRGDQIKAALARALGRE